MKPRSTFLAVTLITVLTFLFSVFPQNLAQAQSTTLTFKPVADAFVSSEKPDTKFGTNKLLLADVDPMTRSYLRFEVTGIKGTAVQSAKLRVYGKQSNPQGFTVNQVGDNGWSEANITFKNSPAPGDQINPSGSIKSSAWVEVDVTRYITSDGTYSLALIPLNSTQMIFYARENGSNIAQLVIVLAASSPTQTVPPAPTVTVPPIPTQTATLVPTATMPPAPTATMPPAPSATVPPAPTATIPATPIAVPSGPTQSADNPIPTDTPVPQATATPTKTYEPMIQPPTYTNTPTLTFTPSNTPTSTNTPTITNTPTATFTPTVTFTPTLTFTPSSTLRSPTPTQQATPISNFYVDGNLGSDSNAGTIDKPWKTIQKAVNTLKAGNTVYVRGGQYDGVSTGWKFANSGTASKPITLTNYPGEQVVFKMPNTTGDHQIFMCSNFAEQRPDWNTPKADYIHIIGSDVSTKTLSDGVQSKKGLVMQGNLGEQSSGIIAHNCDYWEVAGVDFVEVSSGIFAHKDNWGGMTEYSTDHWYVHNNRVYIYYRESGMQFNGDDNLIENNEIYKVTNRLDTPYGCQILNIVGDSNVVRGNTLSRLGSTANCVGIRFEWDLADVNIIERNLIYDVLTGIDIEGGDNNLIRNNIIYKASSPDPYHGGIEVKSYDSSKTDWPCDETLNSPQALLPANDPSHPDYQFYYTPRNCHSYGNQIYNNTIHGFVEGIRIYPLAGENTVIRNNIFSGWTRGSICFYNDATGSCKAIPPEVTASNNATQNFGFVDVLHLDFHLTANSPLIDSGFNLGSLNLNDILGVARPLGAGYDIGAYEAH